MSDRFTPISSILLISLIGYQCICLPYVSDILQSCSEVKKRQDSAKDGIYILTNGVDLVPSYCDMNTAEAGWTVFQRRISDSVSFDRNWAEYKIGFGNMTGNFWWGNDNLAAFTSNRSYVLRIDVKDADGRRYYVEHQNFYIDDEEAKYRLHLGTFRTNITASESMRAHNGGMFSTPDQDNDEASGLHCAQKYHSGWWFRECHNINLNGVYTGTARFGISSYLGDDKYKNYKWTEMKFRSM